MKLNITYIGTPKDVTTKWGVKQKNSIKATEYGDKFISYWLSPANKDWVVGKEVEVAEVTSRKYQGKTYYDIVMPKVDNRPAGVDVKVINEIANRQISHGLLLQKIVDHLSNKNRLDLTSAGTPVPTFDRPNQADIEDIDPASIPF